MSQNWLKSLARHGVLVALLSLLFASQAVYALPGWMYRVPVTITNSSGTTWTNYQVLVELDTQTLIGQGKMRADGGDIRFSTDADGTVQIDHWIESGINTANTRMWVRVPSLPASSVTTIYLFYGNPGAASQSSFENTFPNRYELASGSDTLGGTQAYDWFQVSSGATLNVQDGQTLTVQARAIRIEGTIAGTGAGYQGAQTASSNGSGPGSGRGSTYNGGGAGYGGQGGCAPGSSANYCEAPRGATYGAAGLSIDMGSGGGSGQSAPPDNRGGDGGGTVWLQARAIRVSGTVRVNGGDGAASAAGSFGGGGGSGGGILIQGHQVDLGGATLSARGGRAGNRFGGAGGGGRIKVFYSEYRVGTYTTDVSGETTHTYGGTVKLSDAQGRSGTIQVSTFVSTEPTVSVGSETTFGDLAIAKTAMPEVVEPGQPLTYTLAFSNVGSTTVTNVLISDALPAALNDLRVVSSGATITPTGGITYAWEVQDLAPGQGGVITISGVLRMGLRAGTLGNTVAISSTMPDADPTNNRDTAEVTIPNIAPAIGDTTRSVAENAANGANVGAPVTGTDANGDALSYAIMAGNDDGVLAIDSSTGQITVVDNTNLDHETTPQYVLTVQVSDGALTDTAAVTIDVTDVNEAPHAVDDVANTPEDTPRTITVLANDTDPEGDVLTVIAVGTPAHGTATTNGTTVTYVPDVDFSGADVFNYTVRDPGGLTDTARITVNVGVANDAPDAVDDQAETDEDMPAIVAVLGNDSDLDGDTLFVDAVGTPAHGTATTNGTTVTYTPAPNWNGVDVFTYVVSDGSLTDVATVTVTVVAVNDAPVNAVPGPQSTGVGQELAFSASKGNQVSVSDVDAGSRPVQVALQVTHGLLTLNGTAGLTFSVGDGTADAYMAFVGTIADVNAALNGMRFAPDAGYTGPASLQISTDDQGHAGAGGARSDTDTVNISVQEGGGTPHPTTLYLPLIVRNHITAPDLVVERITVAEDNIQVVIKNQGSAAAEDNFWVDVYIDPQTAPTAVNQVWDQLGDQGLVWGVTVSLPAGETITLTVGDAYYWADLSQVVWPIPAGTPVYAQVDSAHAESDHGAVLESHEISGGAYNNISGPVAAAGGTGEVRAIPDGGHAAPSADLPSRP